MCGNHHATHGNRPPCAPTSPDHGEGPLLPRHEADHEGRDLLKFLFCSLSRLGDCHGSISCSPPTPTGAGLRPPKHRPATLYARGPRAESLDHPTRPPYRGRRRRERRRGRGAQSNASGRYEPPARIAFDDGWQSLEDLPPFKTTVPIDAARKIITRNNSPDISFDRSINPYRGCEHGCVYCFARPTHAYMGLSPGLDFESKLFVKPDAPELLERELSAPATSRARSRSAPTPTRISRSSGNTR